MTKKPAKPVKKPTKPLTEIQRIKVLEEWVRWQTSYIQWLTRVVSRSDVQTFDSEGDPPPPPPSGGGPGHP
jgi:hypothetical protein